ncbi:MULTISPECIES: M56 family metallopeptidase [Actinomycetes]|uniref:Zn-dependent protease with chaperone function n=4 Tax=Actinomycetes TaxID=1760 RepID=A0A7W3NR73_STRMR|nr:MULTISPECIES: M56 family metallopeptidase [Streptomyces]NDK26041.1 M56 family metallopeptidase [Streptomyces sp. TR1341]MBA9055271.1 Zn-dependent protease with chaperone function [Streptomyces murinus]MCE3030979.1 M56 family metallopeptidase [Streptomyces sp. CMSTAAHL-2]TGZ16278.1 membrane protein [Streptomyces sp. S816]UWW89870.1 M48 family metalloprotease [Streptomyces murinus]
MTVCLLLLTVVALTAAGPAPRALTRADWPEREPVVALWVWQCLVATVLLCCLAALTLGTAAVFHTVRDHVFAPAPPAVTAAYDLSAAPVWAAVLTVLLAGGAAWTTAMLGRELVEARRSRGQARAELRERAPELPAGLPMARGPMLVLEDEYPDAWWMPGHPPQLVVTTGALHRLTGHQLDAVLTHERGHARAHHDWLLHLSSALATGFPRVPLFAHFRDQTHRLVELAADDAASRRCGHLTTALALIELNQHRGVLSCASSRRLLGERVDRLLEPPPRLLRRQRALTTTVAALVPLLPLLITFAPGLKALS